MFKKEGEQAKKLKKAGENRFSTTANSSNYLNDIFINEWIDSVQINCSFDHLLTSFISIIIDKNIKIEYFRNYNRYNTPFPRKYYRAISKQYDFWWQCGQANLLNFGV